jgi:hypothetical protein
MTLEIQVLAWDRHKNVYWCINNHIVINFETHLFFLQLNIVLLVKLNVQTIYIELAVYWTCLAYNYLIITTNRPHVSF